MTRPILKRASLPLAAAVVLFVIGAAVKDHIAADSGLADTLLTVMILIAAVATLYVTAPRPACLVVAKPDELDTVDLLFYEVADGTGTYDFGLQLHVAVANVGNRTGVLSAIRIDGFEDEAGHKGLNLPLFPTLISGAQWVQRSGYINGQTHTEALSNPTPIVLQGDDVTMIRFRVRRGIDWGENWTVDALVEFHNALKARIVKAHGIIVWRAGTRVIHEEFTVAVTSEGLPQFLEKLREETHELTTRPRYTWRQPHLV